MKISEKVAYLKGLSEGLAIDPESKEGKLFSAIIDVLDEIAANIADIEENALDLGEEIDVLSDDLAAVEDIVYDDEDDEDEEEDDECECGCGCDDDECDCDCEDGCDCGCEDDEYPLFFEVTCPSCDNTITIDEDVLNLGTIQCPNCGEMLEFDLDSIEEDGCDCGCDCDKE